mmetsp:Transcript_50168/g.154994  ORF Transcript_50168/g.154994 Transcript_50168/m.154994 type:complete len:211 (-) Transcript_50168:334-966(-)
MIGPAPAVATSAPPGAAVAGGGKYLSTKACASSGVTQSADSITMRVSATSALRGMPGGTRTHTRPLTPMTASNPRRVPATSKAVLRFWSRPSAWVSETTTEAAVAPSGNGPKIASPVPQSLRGMSPVAQQLSSTSASASASATRAYTRSPTASFGRFVLDAPSKASASSDATAAAPMCTLYACGDTRRTTPTTPSPSCGTYRFAPSDTTR